MKILSTLLLTAFLFAACSSEESFTPQTEASFTDLFDGLNFEHEGVTHTINVDSVKSFTYETMPIAEFSDSTVYARSVFEIYTSWAGVRSQINIYYFEDSDENQQFTFSRFGRGVQLSLQRWLPDSSWQPSGNWFLLNKPYIMFQETSSAYPNYLEAQRAAFLDAEW